MARDQIRLSRRKLLAGMGLGGVAAGGAGLGTTALFSDSESFTDNDLTAGTLDLKIAWRKTINEELANANGIEAVETSSGWPTPTNDLDAPVCDLTDVKPGDGGHIEFRFRLDSNPGYVSLLGAEQRDDEAGQPEPERSALDEPIPVGAEGELDELLVASVSYGQPTDDGVDTGVTAYRGSLASLVGLGSVGHGLPPDGAGTVPVVDLVFGRLPDAFAAGEVHGLRVDFELPERIGNGVQADAFEFSFGFYTEQQRHNQP